jgi:hypothetical protein
MLEQEGPYSQEELRHMRRLIVASGADVEGWVRRTRRSAEFVRSLSPLQADVITAQALAVGAEPEAMGAPEAMQEAESIFADVDPAERHKRLWHLLLDIRRRHHPDIAEFDTEP